MNLSTKNIDILYETLNNQRWDKNHFFLATWILLAPFFKKLSVKPKLFVFLKTKKNEKYFIDHIFNPLLSNFVYHSWTPNYRTFQIKKKPVLITSIVKQTLIVPLAEFFYSQDTNEQSFLIIGKNLLEFKDLLIQKKELIAWVDLKSFYFEIENFLDPDLRRNLYLEVKDFLPLIEMNLKKINEFLSENFYYKSNSSVSILISAWFAFALKREVGKKDLINFTRSLNIS